MQKIQDPITLTVEPCVRVIMRRGNEEKGEPMIVEDLQTVIHTMSLYIRRQNDRLQSLEIIIKSKKNQLKEYQETITKLTKSLFDKQGE